jgi:hypothetical protein
MLTLDVVQIEMSPDDESQNVWSEISGLDMSTGFRYLRVDLASTDSRIRDRNSDNMNLRVN